MKIHNTSKLPMGAIRPLIEAAAAAVGVPPETPLIVCIATNNEGFGLFHPPDGREVIGLVAKYGAFLCTCQPAIELSLCRPAKAYRFKPLANQKLRFGEAQFLVAVHEFKHLHDWLNKKALTTGRVWWAQFCERRAAHLTKRIARLGFRLNEQEAIRRYERAWQR